MKPSPQPDPPVKVLHCCVAAPEPREAPAFYAVRDSTFEIRNSYTDPYAAPIHRRIDALLLVFCIGLCAVLLSSAYAKHRSVRQSSPNEEDRTITLVSDK